MLRCEATCRLKRSNIVQWEWERVGGGGGTSIGKKASLDASKPYTSLECRRPHQHCLGKFHEIHGMSQALRARCTCFRQHPSQIVQNCARSWKSLLVNFQTCVAITPCRAGRAGYSWNSLSKPARTPSLKGRERRNALMILDLCKQQSAATLLRKALKPEQVRGLRLDCSLHTGNTCSSALASP